ncbi:GNAT family N-acetyltransferase [bacterium]|nr:GNAT family N-acetyltransferase [bacterium]
MEIIHTPFTIREATPSDIISIGNLAHQLGYQSEIEDIKLRFNIISSNKFNIIFVAQKSYKRIIGWVHIMPRQLLIADATAEIGGIIVDKNHRGQGVGRLLMLKAEQWAQLKGYNRIIVRSNILRNEAHKFYPNIGYEMIKSQAVYKKIFNQ